MAASGAHLALCDLSVEAGDKAVKELTEAYPNQKFTASCDISLREIKLIPILPFSRCFSFNAWTLPI
jgi:hypothetical protein